MPSPRRQLWTAGFLAVTLVALGLELYSSFDGNDATVPWTWLLIDYVPAWITVPAAVILAVWLPIHFMRRYKRGRKPGGKEW